MTKRTIVIILLAALTVFNISALATLFFARYSPTEKDVAASLPDTSRMPDSLQLPKSHYALWFRNQLQLDEAQFEVFREANRNYHREGAALLDELALTRAELLDELHQNEPDEGELKYYSERVGELHVQLKELTINYYLTMKNACNEKQRERLFNIFKAMTESEESAAIPAHN